MFVNFLAYKGSEFLMLVGLLVIPVICGSRHTRAVGRPLARRVVRASPVSLLFFKFFRRYTVVPRVAGC